MNFKKKRIDYNNNWPNEKYDCDAENKMLELFSDNNIRQILIPIKLPLIEEVQFQRLLSFKIDIYENLPKRPDIAFDLAWRTFEAHTAYHGKTKNWTVKKSHKVFDKVNEDILNNKLSSNQLLTEYFDDLFKSIPLQATEFIIKRTIEHPKGAIKSQHKQIKERVENSLGIDLVTAIIKKYTPFDSAKQRRAGTMCQILLREKEIVLENKKYTITDLQRLKFLISGLLYTYRNERFHGDAHSPFKSSLTKLKTYAHSYFCLISTYGLICLMMEESHPTEYDLNEIVKSLQKNLNRYNIIFGKQLKK